MPSKCGGKVSPFLTLRPYSCRSADSPHRIKTLSLNGGESALVRRFKHFLFLYYDNNVRGEVILRRVFESSLGMKLFKGAGSTIFL